MPFKVCVIRNLRTSWKQQSFTLRQIVQASTSCVNLLVMHLLLCMDFLFITIAICCAFMVFVVYHTFIVIYHAFIIIATYVIFIVILIYCKCFINVLLIAVTIFVLNAIYCTFILIVINHICINILIYHKCYHYNADQYYEIWHIYSYIAYFIFMTIARYCAFIVIVIYHIFIIGICCIFITPIYIELIYCHDISFN